MFLVNQTYCTCKQLDLLRQADQYRLLKSVKQDHPVIRKAKESLGKKMIQSGQLLVSRTQTAY